MVQVAQFNPGEIGVVLGEMPWGAMSVMEVKVSGQCEQQGMRIDSSLLAVGSAAVQGCPVLDSKPAVPIPDARWYSPFNPEHVAGNPTGRF